MNAIIIIKKKENMNLKNKEGHMGEFERKEGKGKIL